MTKRARIEERTEEIVGEIEWPAQDRLMKLVTRFLDRKRHRKANWHRPMKVAGTKAAKRAIAKIPEPDPDGGAGGAP